jgi:protein-S-isoprenylcysteine O-methyltransferase Ste14
MDNDVGKKDIWQILIEIVLIIAVVSQIMFTLFLYNKTPLKLGVFIGWSSIIISAMLFIPSLSNKKTRMFKDKGAYSIIRHPQKVSGMLLCIGLMFIGQHWLITIVGIIPISIFYLNLEQKDMENLSLYGKDYEKYMQKVPKTNFLFGFMKKTEEKK